MKFLKVPRLNVPNPLRSLRHRFGKNDEGDPRRRANPLRITEEELDIRPAITKKRSPGAAEDILGIVRNPTSMTMVRNVHGRDQEVEIAVFTPRNGKNSLLAAEIDELVQRALEIGEVGRDDDEEEAERKIKAREEIKQEIEKRELKIGYEARAIAYLDSVTKSPFEAFRFLDRGTFLLRSFQQDVGPFLNRLEQVKKWGNSEYASFIEDYKYYVTQTHDPNADVGGLVLRDALIWGEAEQIRPEPQEMTASLYGHVVSWKEAAWVLHETIERHPYTFASRNPIRFMEYRGNPLKYACPEVPFFEDDYYFIHNRKFKIYEWPIQFDAEVLNGILSLDVDMLVCVDMPDTKSGGRQMFATVLLRSSSEVIDGQSYKLDSIERQLRRFNATPLKGQDLRLAFQAFVPGSDILDLRARHNLHAKILPQEARPFFDFLGYKINAGKATSQGNYFFGFKNSDKSSPVFRDAESECVAMAFVGQQQAGKTITSSGLFVLPRTPNVLVIHCSTAHGEAWPPLARRLSGNVVTIRLEDVNAEEYPERDERLEAQKKIDEAAAQDAKKMVSDLERHWIQSGSPVGLPLVIKPAIDTTAFKAFAHTFLNNFSLAYERVFSPKSAAEREEKAEELENRLVFDQSYELDEDDPVGMAVDDPRLCVVFVDDISVLDVEANHPVLGNIPMQEAQTFREVLKTGLYTFRKKRMAFIVTTQSFQHLQKFYPSDAFSTIVMIELKGRMGAKVGTLYDPQKAKDVEEMVVKEDNVDFRLEPYLLNYFQSLHH